MNEVNPIEIARLVAWCGFAIAFVFGAVAAKTHFCTMGAVSDIVVMGDWTRMRMWMLAMAVAMIGAHALDAAGVVALAPNTFYTTPNFNWLSYVVGGAVFGFGMVLGSGCGSKTLVRIGSGNLKSVVVVVFLAIGAYLALRGVLAPLRANVIDKAGVALASTQDLPTLAARAFGVGRGLAAVALVVLVAGGLIAFVFARPEGRSRDVLLGGIVVGLTIPAGWYATGVLGFVAEHPDTLKEAFIGTNSGRMESLTFVGPQAYALDLLMFWTDQSRIVTFGVASVAGVIAGSFAYALATRKFRLEGFRDPLDLLHHMAAGLLMGFGGVTALGCTIGQGLSGLSTLAAGSFITLGAIVAGAVGGLKYQEWQAVSMAERAAARPAERVLR